MCNFTLSLINRQLYGQEDQKLFSVCDFLSVVS
jgi:hypothetical protein